jgi:hypothetical protein
VIQIDDIDLTGWHFLARGVQNALAGTGRDGDAAMVLKDHAVGLAVESARRLPPKSEAVGQKHIERDVDKFLSAPIENIESGDSGSVRWIQAGPGFLSGVRDEDDWRNVDNSGAIAVLRVEQQKGIRQKWSMVGQRGKQKVRIIQRAVVTPLVKHNVVRILSSHVGRMKAQFMEAASKLNGSIRVPPWLSRHFPTLHGIFRNGLGNVDHPFVEFGGSAVGLGKFKGKIVSAVRTEEHKMAKELKQILSFYAKDHNSGRRITKKKTKMSAEEKMNSEMFDAI